MINILEIMSFIVDNRVANLPAKELSEVFDKLIWCMADNGEAINAVRKDWLNGDDIFKVEVAINMTETFPYSTREEMTEKFDRIVKKWPNMKDLCDEIVKEWDEQFDS